MQIKGDMQLEKLKSSVEVMSDKYDEYGKDWKEKKYKCLIDWGQLLKGKDWFTWKISDDSD